MPYVIEMEECFAVSTRGKCRKLYHTIKERVFLCEGGGLTLFHNRLILTPFHMSLPSSEILLFLINNHSI
jgi:hypothetical protein